MNDPSTQWCLTALESFGRTARDLGTPVISLDLESTVARASGIAKAPWPTSSVDGKQIAQYYRILQSSVFEIWAAQDGYGLTQSLNGQFFLEAKSVTASEAAAFVSRVAGRDLNQAKELINAALRGEPYSVG
jgi:hypothetical protein